MHKSPMTTQRVRCLSEGDNFATQIKQRKGKKLSQNPCLLPSLSPYKSARKRPLTPTVIRKDSNYLPSLVLKTLLNDKKTITFAESCTGGSLAATLTKLAGSSGVLKGSLVAYSNEVKTNILGVPKDTIASSGVVSEGVASLMATGAQRLFDADIAVATTGAFGPSGGTEDAPVGTVCFAIAIKEKQNGSKIFTWKKRYADHTQIARTEACDLAVAECWTNLLDRL
eukprot:m.27849 g.27849  ORF g.27849 m.27849 type:complete len:226 (+) comp7944_c0_seq1:215-892(+)